MIASSKINLRKHFGTGQLIKQIFYLGQGVLVLDGDIIQFSDNSYTNGYLHPSCPQTRQVISKVTHLVESIQFPAWNPVASSVLRALTGSYYMVSGLWVQFRGLVR